MLQFEQEEDFDTNFIEAYFSDKKTEEERSQFHSCSTR